MGSFENQKLPKFKEGEMKFSNAPPTELEQLERQQTPAGENRSPAQGFQSM